MGYKDPETQREYQRQWIAKRRAEFFNGKVCAVCGSSEDLELDHIDPKTKTLNPAVLWGMSLTNPKRIAEIAKCQVLCGDHHKDKTRSESVTTTHGTYAMRNAHRCTCYECREYVRIQKRTSRARLRNSGA